MLKRRDIICISSIDWDFVWQGHQEIMSTFARHGNRVLYIENTGVRTPTFRDARRIWSRLKNWFKSVKGFRQVDQNLFVYSPLMVPLPFSRVVRWINRWLMMRPLTRWLGVMNFNRSLVWTFLPTQTALDIIDEVKPHLLVYYYIADFDQLVKDTDKLRKTETALMKKCDVIFAQGEAFKQKCLPFNKNVHIFPFGVNIDIFDQKQMSPDVPSEFQGLPKPIIGYIGGIHRHIDLALIQKLSEAFPEATIAMVGPIQTDIRRLSSCKNVLFTGKKKFSELPAYIREFTVCLVPYELNEFTQTVYPTKINEYHAMGKPVVSTNIPEVVRINRTGLMYVADSHQGFIQKIREAIREDSRALQSQRTTSAQQSSWSVRIEQMASHIEEVEASRGTVVVPWRARFLEMYRGTRRKVLKGAAAFAIIWGLLFYTPLVWHLSAPLKKVSSLKNADAIVVFAGGAGEGGIIRQGYAERVGHAVNLYQRGLASSLLFSSGSRGTYRETFLMKSLALSLGVPGEHIFVEDQSASTYENVTNSVEIARARGWSNLILVSSPYHMLRSALVFKKEASDLNVQFSPMEKSQFYQRKSVDERGKRKWRQIEWVQVKALFHEYAAIAYYRWRGYL